MKQLIVFFLCVSLLLLFLSIVWSKESFASISVGPVAPTNNWLPFTTDWKQTYYALCSMYQNETLPTNDGECPDSSFTYVSNVNANRPGGDASVRYPGCMQLKESPYCYMLPDQSYVPDILRLSHKSA